MRKLNISDSNKVSGAVGAASFILSAAGRGGSVLSDALNGSAPAPISGLDFLTATATGPTPGNVGGRYRISEIGKPASIGNVGGGEFGRSAGKLIQEIRRGQKAN